MTGSRVEVRRASTRARTTESGRDTAHSFSFGRHYDSADTGHGLLVAHNDEVLAPGAGYPSHPHRDLEVVTWVLRCALVHRYATGRTELVLPGQVQRMSAGRGVVHAETNDAHELDPARAPEPVRFVQAWVLPGALDTDPAYDRRAVAAASLEGALVPVASGRAEHAALTAVRLGQRDAALLVARLAPGQRVTVPDAVHVHVFVATGRVHLQGVGPLHEADAARLTAAGRRELAAAERSEVLVWVMHAGLGP